MPNDERNRRQPGSDRRPPTPAEREWSDRAPSPAWSPPGGAPRRPEPPRRDAFSGLSEQSAPYAYDPYSGEPERPAPGRGPADGRPSPQFSSYRSATAEPAAPSAPAWSPRAPEPPAPPAWSPRAAEPASAYDTARFDPAPRWNEQPEGRNKWDDRSAHEAGYADAGYADSDGGSGHSPAPAYNAPDPDLWPGESFDPQDADEPAARGYAVADPSYDSAEDERYIRSQTPLAVQDDAAFVDDYDPEFAPAPRRSRKLLLVAVLVGTALAGGSAAFVYLSGENGGSGADAPLVAADDSPLREAPAAAGGRDFPNRTKLIYDRLSDRKTVGGSESAGAASAEAAQQASVAPSGGIESRIESALREAQGGASSTTPAASNAESSAGESDRPRPVDAMVMRPDGTMEMAASSSPPVAVAPTAALPRAAPRQRIAAATPPAPQVAAPVTTAAVRPTAAASASGYFVQLGARQDQAAANAAIAEVQQKYGAALGGFSPELRRVDLGAKGVWYRLLAGPLPEKTAAAELCEKLKGAGLPACLVQVQQ